ncbi:MULTISPECIES: type II toxin-antitoxin system prevent-host-death family antitoxin [unclassified Roseitalea]|uniref:type II toxin-antitoxin system Phd/YefM family antitoxin n=1 Tax=unclassified Roseitalea TaxID=2639107 RepID=UPI00273FE9EE|nr:MULTISPECIES: type II toxin-antitoxin system prevent-host-death family antitoxin [unclassified Roseitalea]
MAIVSQSEFRANIAKLLDQVEDDRKELIVTRQGKQPMVVIPLEEYESWKETDYLLSNPVNRAVLLESIRQLDAGEGIEMTIEELKAALENAADDAA